MFILLALLLHYNENMINIIDQTKNKELKKYTRDINSFYKKGLEVLGVNDDFELSLIIVGKKKIRNINRDYRHIDRETDVISFAEIDSEDEFGDNNYLGDIFINVDRVKKQAKLYGHSIKREYCFLFVHGLLHLFGYDHMNEKDEKRMFDIQDKIIGELK